MILSIINHNYQRTRPSTYLQKRIPCTFTALYLYCCFQIIKCWRLSIITERTQNRNNWYSQYNFTAGNREIKTYLGKEKLPNESFKFYFALLNSYISKSNFIISLTSVNIKSLITSHLNLIINSLPLERVLVLVLTLILSKCFKKLKRKTNIDLHITIE